MRRREFLGGFGVLATLPLVAGAATVIPLAVRAQPKIPIIGILGRGTREAEPEWLTACVTSLRQAGLVEGQNLGIEYCFANNRFERLASLAADLVRRNVSVLFTVTGTIAALAAKAATDSVPIVFVTGGDPVKAGLVAS